MWNEHRLAREVRFIWHVLPRASTIPFKRHIQEDLKGQTPESFDEVILCMSLSNDINGQRKAIQKLVCTMSKKWQRQARTLVLPGQKIRGGTEIPTNFKEHVILSLCEWLTYSSVILPTRFFQRQSHHRLVKERRKPLHFQGTFDN